MYSGKKVVEADIETLRLMINEYDAAVLEQKQLMQELEQLFTGTTADAISQSIADGFMNGKRSIEDFADDFETLMKNAVKASFRINVTDALAKDFYQKFVDATQSDFMLTADEIAALKEDFKQQIENASDQWAMFEDILSQAGIDIAEASKQQREVGGFQTLSQQTGYDLLGQFTAFRIHAGDLVKLVSDLFIDFDSIIPLFQAITDNTENTVAELRTLNERVKRIEVEGIKVN